MIRILCSLFFLCISFNHSFLQVIQYIGAAQYRSPACTGTPDLISYYQTERCTLLGPGVNFPAMYTCQDDGTILQQLFNMSDFGCSGEPFQNSTLEINGCQGPFIQFPQETSPGFSPLSCDSNPIPFGERPDLFPEGEGEGQIISTGIYLVEEEICSSLPVIAFFQRPRICGLNLDETGHIVSSELNCIRDEDNLEQIFLDQNRYLDSACRNISDNLLLPANVCQTNLFGGAVHVVSRCDNVLFPSPNDTTSPSSIDLSPTDENIGLIIGTTIASVFFVCCIFFIIAFATLFFFRKDSKDLIIDQLNEEGLLQGIKLIDSKKLVIKEELGSGFSGKVSKAQYGSIFVAVKFSDSSAVNILNVAKEFGIHAKIPKHPNVVSFEGFTVEFRTLCIVLEYCDKGSLKEYIDKHRNDPIPLKTVLGWLIGISKGLLCIHQQKIVHRDIAARNILLSTDEKTGEDICKVADFGFSKAIEDNDSYYSTDTTFPIKWIAPEGFIKKQSSVKSDIWSFGVLILEILTREMPFPDVKKELFAAEWKMYLGKISEEIPDDTPKALKEVLKEKIFKMDPDERANTEELSTLFSSKQFKRDFMKVGRHRGSFLPHPSTSSCKTTSHDEKPNSEGVKTTYSENLLDSSTPVNTPPNYIQLVVPLPDETYVIHE